MKKINRPHVAITQPSVILGGRFQVILSVVQALNELGIEPDILTFGMNFKPEDIFEKYGRAYKMNFRLIKPDFSMGFHRIFR